MKTLGYSSLAMVATIAAVAVVGTTTYVAVTNPEPIKNIFSLSQTSSSTPSASTPPTSTEEALSVNNLLGSKDAYVGQHVRVTGDILVHVMYSEKPCAADEVTCDTSMGARLELWQAAKKSGEENMILLFKNAAPYPCTKTAPGIFSCGSYSTGGPTTIEGVWSKDREPTQWVGSSGGQPPTPVKWKDRYFLNVE